MFWVAAVKAQIEVNQYDFTGGVELDENGDFVTDTEGQQYVGTPSLEVDRAGSDLMEGLWALHPPHPGTQRKANVWGCVLISQLRSRPQHRY